MPLFHLLVTSVGKIVLPAEEEIKLQIKATETLSKESTLFEPALIITIPLKDGALENNK